MNELLCAGSEQIKQGGIAALKMLGAVVGAAIVLWLVMILARYLGNSIEKRKYDQYVQDYTHDHPDQEGMIGFDQFVSMRAAGTKVVYTRSASPQPYVNATTTHTTEDTVAQPQIPDTTGATTLDPTASNTQVSVNLQETDSTATALSQSTTGDTAQASDIATDTTPPTEDTADTQSD